MIKLKTLSEQDVFPFYEWLNDSESIKYSLSAFQKINSKTEIDLWFETILKDQKNLNLGIFLEESNKLIGYAGICSISQQNKSGEYFIFIGDKSVWGKGIGSKVSKQIIKIAFQDKKLNRLMLTVSAPNIGGVKAYQKAGFNLEGRLRQACFRDGALHDKLIMSVLKEDYLKTINS